jgi:hypothetical protein
MTFLIAGFLLIHFDAGLWWWVAYYLFVAFEMFGLYAEVKKNMLESKTKKSQLLKANGQPYTEADLEFIWKHGYQSALEMVQQTKQ